MRSLPFLALLLVAAGLAASIGWQLEATGPASLAPRRPAATAQPEAPQAAPPNRAAERAEISLARPLFSPDRRPPKPGATASVAPDLALPRLTGILVGPGGSSAIFAGGPPPIVVREGGRVGSFTVRSIEPGQVTLLGPDGLRSVRPTFGPARAPVSPQSPSLQIGGPPGPGNQALPRLPASSPALPDAPKDAMPFEQNPAPSGLDILRNQAERARGERAPAR